MRAAGFEEQDMRNWHIQFEEMEPDAHQEFLESLGIQAVEIQNIRRFRRRFRGKTLTTFLLSDHLRCLLR
jgi:hypothetical protein